MRNGILLLFFLAVLGCRTPSPPEPAQDASAREKSTALLTAIRHDDRAAFCERLTPEYAAQFTPERFSALQAGLRRQFGTMERFVFLDELAVPPFRNCVFKVTFRPNGRKDRPPPPPRDALFRTLCGSADGREVILGFGFF